MISSCYCGSQISYSSCCGLYIDTDLDAPTPEALMRSRYSAYSTANINYIKKTMKGKALIGFNEAASKQWAQQTQWLGLQVVQHYRDKSNESKGFVEYIVTYLYQNKRYTIHELSEFQCIEGHWFYTDGQDVEKVSTEKIGRNAPCPCGSQKKFKNCHDGK